MGNINEEYDVVIPEIQIIGPNEYLLDGRLLINNLNKELGLNIENDDCDTISGYFIEQLGHIPEDGAKESISVQNLVFSTEEVEGNRIVSVKLKIKNPLSMDEK